MNEAAPGVHWECPSQGKVKDSPHETLEVSRLLIAEGLIVLCVCRLVGGWRGVVDGATHHGMHLCTFYKVSIFVT